MATGEYNLATHDNKSPINGLLLKLIHHELGNGLAVLEGYRHLLQRAILHQAQETAPPEPEVWRQRNEQWLDYLQVMQKRELLLNDFLAQLRELSPGTIPDHFCQNFTRMDLRTLLDQVLAQFAPLSPERRLDVHLPDQALSILCDHFWLETILGHIVGHTIASHTAATPIEITLAPSTDLAHLVQEVKITLQIEQTPSDARPASENSSAEPWSQALPPGDGEICLAMCREVLQEHGGRIWWEQKTEHQWMLCVTFPLLKEREQAR